MTLLCSRHRLDASSLIVGQQAVEKEGEVLCFAQLVSSFHRLMVLVVGLVAVAQLLDLIKFILNHFGEDQFFPLVDGVLAFVDQMIVLTWPGLEQAAMLLASPRRPRRAT